MLNLLTRLSIMLLAMLIIPYIALANPLPHFSKNLSAVNYENKAVVTQNIRELFQDADQSSAYALSLPLMASALQGDRDLYLQILMQMMPNLQSMPDNEFKAWMLGRVLIAAHDIEDQAASFVIHMQLRMLISRLRNKPFDYHSQEYAFYAWACGYLAASSPEDYANLLPTLQESSAHLINTYYDRRTHEAFSNLAWAWTMNLLAAANANDLSTYHSILNQIIELTGSSSLEQGTSILTLNRTQESSDYPAWAIAIAELSAGMLADTANYYNLLSVVKNSLTSAGDWQHEPGQTAANQWKAKAEIVLGTLNDVLAKTRVEEVLPIHNNPNGNSLSPSKNTGRHL